MPATTRKTFHTITLREPHNVDALLTLEAQQSEGTEPRAASITFERLFGVELDDWQCGDGVEIKVPEEGIWIGTVEDVEPERGTVTIELT